MFSSVRAARPRGITLTHAFLVETWKVLGIVYAFVCIALVGLTIFVVSHVPTSPAGFFATWDVWRYIAPIPVYLFLILFTARVTRVTVTGADYLYHAVVTVVVMLYEGFLVVYELLFVMSAGFQWAGHLYGWVTQAASGPLTGAQCPDGSATHCRTDEVCINNADCVTAHVRAEWVIFMCVVGAALACQGAQLATAKKLRSAIDSAWRAVPTNPPRSATISAHPAGAIGDSVLDAAVRRVANVHTGA